MDNYSEKGNVFQHSFLKLKLNFLILTWTLKHSNKQEIDVQKCYGPRLLVLFNPQLMAIIQTKLCLKKCKTLNIPFLY